MANVFLTVVGNTSPGIQLTLKRSGKAIPLGGVIATLVISNKKTKAITNAGHQQCAIVSANNGQIAYNVLAGDFPDANVDYEGKVFIDYPGGGHEQIYETLTINPRAA